jgi:fatty acid desaturase
MNYHFEHQMFLIGRSQALPRLLAAIKADCPLPSPNCRAACPDVIYAIKRQMRESGLHVVRKLPDAAKTVPGNCDTRTVAAE